MEPTRARAGETQDGATTGEWGFERAVACFEASAGGIVASKMPAE